MEFLLKCTNLNSGVFILLAEVERATVTIPYKAVSACYICAWMCAYTAETSICSLNYPFLNSIPTAITSMNNRFIRTCTFKLPYLDSVTVFTCGMSPSSKVHQTFITFHIGHAQ